MKYKTIFKIKVVMLILAIIALTAIIITSVIVNFFPYANIDLVLFENIYNALSIILLLSMLLYSSADLLGTKELHW